MYPVLMCGMHSLKSFFVFHSSKLVSEVAQTVTFRIYIDLSQITKKLESVEQMDMLK